MQTKSGRKFPSKEEFTKKFLKRNPKKEEKPAVSYGTGVFGKGSFGKSAKNCTNS